MTVETREQCTERRPRLRRDRVLQAAVELADRQGTDSLTMRILPHALGVEAMSLYDHVANKDDLLDDQSGCRQPEPADAHLDGHE